MKTSFRFITFAGGVLAGLVFASTLPYRAEAYIPPSEFIVKKIAEKRGNFKTLILRSTVVGMSGEKPTGAHFKTQTTYDARTRTLRSRAVNDAGVELYRMERRLGSASETGSADRAAVLADALLLESDATRLVQTLREAGVPVKIEQDLAALETEEARRAAEVTSLGRWNNGVVWKIGPQGKSDRQPQVWVEKDSFLPLRLLARSGGEVLDLRFQQYRLAKDLPVPRQILLGQGGTDQKDVILREELTEVTVDPQKPEARPQDFKTGFTEAGNSADSDVRELIQKYYRFVR